MSVLQMQEWKSASGFYYVNFPKILRSERINLAAQDVMGMSTIEFLLYIKTKFNAEIVLYKDDKENNIKWYGYYFHSSSDCHKHVLEINALARKNNIKEEDYI